MASVLAKKKKKKTKEKKKKKEKKEEGEKNNNHQRTRRGPSSQPIPSLLIPTKCTAWHGRLSMVVLEGARTEAWSEDARTAHVVRIGGLRPTASGETAQHRQSTIEQNCRAKQQLSHVDVHATGLAPLDSIFRSYCVHTESSSPWWWACSVLEHFAPSYGPSVSIMSNPVSLMKCYTHGR